jgi:hypothetical protein
MLLFPLKPTVVFLFFYLALAGFIKACTRVIKPIARAGFLEAISMLLGKVLSKVYKLGVLTKEQLGVLEKRGLSIS